MEKANGGKNIPPKPSRWRKGFGANSLQISEDDASTSALVGGIVEKGFFSEGPQNKPLAPTPSPRPTVLPFPVARHRSHGPHWAPIGSEKSGRGVDDRDEEDEEEEFMGFGPLAAASAHPVQRKEKKGMDFSQLKDLAMSEGSSPTQKKKQDKSFLESIEQKKANEVTEKSNKRSSPIGTGSNGLPQNLPPDNFSQAQDVFMEEMDSRSVEEVSQDVIVETREETMEDREEMEPGFSDVSKRQRQPDIEKSKMSTKHLTSSYTPSNMGNEQDSTGIDAENRARLERMSADEIAEAQAEILDKMSPAVIEALRKRGQNKLKKQPPSIPARVTKGEVGNVRDDTKLVKEEKGSPLSVSDTSTTMTTPASTTIRRGQGDNGLQNLSPDKSWWDSWSERVEAVRELRFSLDGNVVETDFGQVTKTGNVSTQSGYNTDNVSERDLLRTEGDPAAAGYTIKEAIALTRSVIPGQRALALHLLASVLDKALHKIIQNNVCYNVKMANTTRFIDWAAVWAYALGPEPELALSLRMLLDDHHNSVVLACAKVIQGVLSFDTNEIFFDISEKYSCYQKDMCTAPIFRSRPDIDVGFLQGGFWKYNAKPSNILPFGEDIDNNKTEDEHTIQDDVVVAGQDVVAGLVRMGILPRILYLLETDPSDVLEECLISILIAIARHSPTCARAIMKCQRLVQTVVHRFTTKEPMEVNTSKIKSVTLLRVLARSEKKNCVDFLRNGVFRSATWHLYQYAPPLDRWIELGKEKCKLSSALMVEQLRFWKVCIQYGYFVANFSDFFPALCMWLNVPTFEQLIDNRVLGEFAAITKEAFFVLGALTRRLPNFYSHMHVSNQVSDVAADELESWSWVHVGPMVDFAIKWAALRSNPCMSNLFEWQKGNRSSSIVQHLPANSLLRLVSAALHMLSGVLDKVIPEDAMSLPGGSLPWLPEFVPKIGLEIIKNGFLSFSGMNDACSFTQYLCRLRHQGEHESSFASVSCLRELVKVVISVDKLIQLAKPSISTPLAHSYSSSREDLVLSGGIVKSSIPELRDALATFMKLINSEWQWVQSTEIFGRGGPAPGVGVGWGAAGGGFWSKDVLLAQTDAGLLISLLEVFQIVSTDDLLTVEDMDFTMQKINSAFDICLTLGPRDRYLMEKVLDTLLQVPVLKYLDLSIRHFITLNKDLKPFGWDYAEKDYQLFSKVLASHFRNRWLTVKKKLKALDRNSGLGKMSSKKGGLLDTIHEDLDMSNMTPQQDNCPSLAVEWAHQRLPLPMQWFLSPISTINGIAHADPSIPSRNIEMENHTDFLEIAKAGLFFLLGIEVMSAFVAPEIECSVRRAPLAWKLHSLSVTLLGGMGVLGEEKSRDTYEALQEVYGKILHESWLTKSKEVILEGTEKFPAQTGKKTSVEFLCFQSEIHESYSTFMETLVEQFAAASYGDLIYGRQVVIYLHRCVESSTRLAAWNALSNARVLELLPPLGNCFASGEGYLEPIEVNERILEAYLKSWVSGALDRASTRGSIAFTLVLHHLSSFVFCCITSDKLLLRNKLVKSLLRDYSRKPQHEGMMLDFVHYQKPGQREGSSMPMHEVDKRFKILTEACDGNSSLLHDVETLKLSFQRKLCS